MIEVSSQEIFDEAIKFLEKGSYYQTSAYDTYLFITDDESYDPFHRFEILGHKILWINPVVGEIQGEKKPLMVRTIFMCDPESYEGVILMNRFASLLCYVTQGSMIIPRVWTGFRLPAPTVTQPQEMSPSYRFTHESIEMAVNRLEPNKINDKKWIGLAHYRQAIISRSEYYRYLSFWKILELYFEKKTAPMKEYVNNAYTDRVDWFSDLDMQNKSAWDRLLELRHQSAHFALDGEAFQNPDDPEVFNDTVTGIFPLKRIVEKLIDTGDW